MLPFKKKLVQKKVSLVLTLVGVGIMFLQPIPDVNKYLSSTFIGFTLATIGIIYLVEAVS